MNEITILSEDLKIHGAKIRMSKNRVGHEIIEIGRELTEAKEKCKHGEWLPFLEKECEISQQDANEFMRLSKEFENHEHVRDLGRRALLYLSRLPNEQKKKTHELSSGEKTIYEMNEKEVNELRKQLEEEKRKRFEVEKSEQIALKNLERIENKEPEIITKEVIKEVIPEGIRNKIDEKERLLENAKSELKKLKEENKVLQIRKTNYDEKEAIKKQKALEREANIGTLELIINIQQFLKDSTLSAYHLGAIASVDIETKNKIKENLKMLEAFIGNLKNAINGKLIEKGDI